MPTTTPNLGLTLPDLHEEGWGPPILNVDFMLIDTFAATTIQRSPTVSQTVNQPDGTYLNINLLQVYGPTPVVRFGVGVNVWDTAISRPAAGEISLDSNTVGNGLATVVGGIFNAQTGFKLNGAAPAGHALIGNGTEYVDSALPTGYTTIQSGGTSLTQRGKLNFLAPLTAVDDPGNTSSDIGLAASGVAAGSYTAASITVTAKGIVTAASSTSAARARVSFNGLGGVTIKDSLNIANVIRSAAGEYIVTFATPMSSANYTILISGGTYNSPTGGTFVRAELYDASGGGVDPTATSFTVAGIYTSGASLQLSDLERCDIVVFSN